MQRLLSTALAFLLLTTLGTGIASAKTCRDVHGKFMKCVVAKPAPVRCRDSHGRFMKCKPHHM